MLPLLAPHRQRLPETALFQEVDVQPHGRLPGQHPDGKHVEHHLDIAHRIDMAVEVDVAVHDAVVGGLRGIHLADLVRFVRRGSGIDDGVGMGVAHPRKVDRRTALQVDHRPLRHGPAELAPRSRVGQREITCRKHTPVVADPRRNLVIGVLHGPGIELHGHTRKHPRVVVGIQRIDAEAFAVGVDARRIEDRSPQRGDRRPQREIHILRLDPVIIA